MYADADHISHVIRTSDHESYSVDKQSFERIRSALNIDTVTHLDDAELFRRWTYLAHTVPGHCARILATCITPDDYRRVLTEAMK